MNPYDHEQRLRDEVIYLHSLWHQGPPRHNPNPTPTPIQDTHNPSRTLHKIPKNTSRDSGPQWPVDPLPSPRPATTGWPELKPKAPPEPVSEQDQPKLLALQVQNKVLERCRKFLSKRVDDEESDEDDEYEELGEEDYVSESDEYRFLLDLFVSDDKLRDYYEINHESGEFCCLVCGGIGEKLNKRYKDCLGLVQHATAVSKTKRKRTHRAFGRVVCKVLGWDFDRLPVIVLKGETLGRTLANLSATQGEEAEGNADNYKEDVTAVKHNEGFMTETNSEIVEKEVSNVSKKDAEIQNSFEVGDASKCVENLDAKFLNMEADKEVAVECQETIPSLVASNSWPCIEPVDELSPIASGWPALKPKKPLVIQLASAEDQVKLAAVKLQHKVSEACREFFDKNAGSEGGEDDEEEKDNIMDENDDEDGDNLIDEDESEDSEDFKFFLKVFSENSELRNYYEKNYEAGEFCCLVCGGIGKKVWKRFKDCLGLLQHSTAISKTKKKQAHRAFGKVVSKVLGWDIDRLPTIVSKGVPLGQSLAKSGVLLGEVETNAGDNKDELTAPKNNADSESDQKEDSYSHQSALMISENSSIEDDTIKDVNDIYREGNEEGATDVLVPQESDVFT
ncbi:hypothetical protein ACOSQ3_031572 [Xanthoceras sorbifolium]